MKQLERVIGMCRGVGDPLVAAYLRAYLAYKGSSLWWRGVSRASPRRSSPTFCRSTACCSTRRWRREAFYCATSGITRGDYLALLDPAVDWTLRCCARRADVPTLKRVLELGGDAPPPPFLKRALRAMLLRRGQRQRGTHRRAHRRQLEVRRSVRLGERGRRRGVDRIGGRRGLPRAAAALAEASSRSTSSRRRIVIASWVRNWWSVHRART